MSVVDVPATVDLSLRLLWVEDRDGTSHGEVATADDNGPGGSEEVTFNEDIGFSNQTGWYEVIVESSDGSSCSSDYSLIINGNSR